MVIILSLFLHAQLVYHYDLERYSTNAAIIWVDVNYRVHDIILKRMQIKICSRCIWIMCANILQIYATWYKSNIIIQGISATSFAYFVYMSGKEVNMVSTRMFFESSIKYVLSGFFIIEERRLWLHCRKNILKHIMQISGFVVHFSMVGVLTMLWIQTSFEYFFVG